MHLELLDRLADHRPIDAKLDSKISFAGQHGASGSFPADNAPHEICGDPVGLSRTASSHS